MTEQNLVNDSNIYSPYMTIDPIMQIYKKKKLQNKSKKEIQIYRINPTRPFILLGVYK